MKKIKVCPRVVNGLMTFHVIKTSSEFAGNDISKISKKRLLRLNIQRYVIRKAQVVTSKEVRSVENKYNRFAKP